MFSPHEILEIALNIEVEGYKFYMTMAKNSNREDAKSTFQYLAKQEEEHMQTFKTLLKRFEEEADNLINWDEASDYLKTMSEHKVFPDSATLVKRFANSEPEEVIRYAIEREKETVIFYYELLEIITDNEAKEAVKKIIVEEKKHVVTLRELL
ncbi:MULTISPECIES: ferritin family protein [Kosmotoga]|uniref:Rubrerythrin n=1 Tax=Kosmotoga olearia (strain ATCC BAA-1733 / DSM 21960 / TBF 19.5.1) TaxID=521045 RepID=C5CDG3_KOSOT|nr:MULTISPECIES: ferritin family protein [Kosmotoga]ACR79047.1 Rubrerythrin [Kosmotoga olearia TBF 19.5.1]MDI3524023.1 hypothetical protein [Kosmotoga sp.]MDK2953997.1 hypothetical protein [Kosmotoga sp.]OAA23755.1 hypothetical protein DU53_01565 [Kosmotoga sp. DU53]